MDWIWSLTGSSSSTTSQKPVDTITDRTTSLELGDVITDDRISTLEDKLLSHILCFLPTKDAVAMSLSSKTMMRRIFSLITTLDFDDSPLSHCVERPHLIERYPNYKNFVDTVILRASQRHLTKFRLQIGRVLVFPYSTARGEPHCCDYPRNNTNNGRCFPLMDPMQLKTWMCYPLTRKVRELDLSIHVNVTEPSGRKLPPEIFTSDTLEVLKLDVNLETPRQEDYFCFSLPNLKVLRLSSIVIVDDEFVSSLVSSCPSLEDLTLQYCTWKHEDFITISSTTLRRLVLDMMEGTWGFKTHEDKGSQSVVIDTPNLQSLTYSDNLACESSITNMNAIVTAEIIIGAVLEERKCEYSLFTLLKALSNVQQLSLKDSFTQFLNSAEPVLRDQLPMFHNLNYLELGCNEFMIWDQALLKFLHCSPFLETLVFPEGLSRRAHSDYKCHEDLKAAKLEPQAWRTTDIPSCCRSHLKRIVVKYYAGSERELNLIAFLLRNTSVLEELVVYLRDRIPPKVDQSSFESTLKNLPRASINCSVKWIKGHRLF